MNVLPKPQAWSDATVPHELAGGRHVATSHSSPPCRLPATSLRTELPHPGSVVDVLLDRLTNCREDLT